MCVVLVFELPSTLNTEDVGAETEAFTKASVLFKLPRFNVLPTSANTRQDPVVPRDLVITQDGAALKP